MSKKAVILLTLCILSASFLALPVIGSTTTNTEIRPSQASIVPETFALKQVENQELVTVGGRVYGITFDNRGSMYVAKNGNELVKITPDGKGVTFCQLDAANSSPSTYIWSLRLGKDGNIYAAAMDRLLKITPEGKAETMFQDPSLKLMSVDFDRQGNLYAASGTQIFKYTPALEKSLFIDCGGTSGYLGLADLKFDPGFNNLYVSNYNNQQLYKYPLKSDGTAGEKKVILDTKWLAAKVGSARPNWYTIAGKAHPSWFSFDGQGNLYVSLEDIYSVLKIGTDNSYTIYEIEKSFFVSTIAFGKNGFEQKSIYTPGYKDGSVHKLNFDGM